MMNPFRPEHESEADCTSTTWLYRDGYDPRALVGFFERLHRRLGDGPVDPAFSFGRTHPYSLDRRRDVLDRLAQLQPVEEAGRPRPLRRQPPEVWSRGRGNDLGLGRCRISRGTIVRPPKIRHLIPAISPQAL